MPRIVGIDLGTTNSCVAVVEGGRAVVLPNKQGYTTTPSVLAITDAGARLVGQLAVRQAVTNAAHTVHGSKRLLGRPWGTEEVEHARAHASYTIVEGPHGDLRIVLQGREHSVPELSAMILQEMRLLAEDHLHEPVDRAVITVPAYFNDAQRQAVRDAGRIAGLDVVRILNEPTAAAVAYGFGKEGAQGRTLAVYDLGGGTFDLSIVRMDEAGELHVIATTGDSFLGGEDFDERVMGFLAEDFLMHHGVDLRDSPMSLARLREASQKAKTELSALQRVGISLPFVVTDPPLHLEHALTRDELEDITHDLIERTLQICGVGLQYAQLAPSAIDEVILVGGMTRMPAIQRAVREFFGREPCKGVHPDEVVALGAAIAGDAIANERTNVRLHDVTAHSLGIMTAGGGFDVLIPANSAVPSRTTSVFGTSRDGQTTVKIVVLQGESARAAENQPLGRFALTGLRQAAAGEVEIEVTFRIDEDGMFSVGAKDLETGEEKSIDVLAGSGLDEEEIDRMMRDSADYLATRRSEEASEGLRQTCRVLLADVDRLMPQARERVAKMPVGKRALDNAERDRGNVEAQIDRADVATLQHCQKELVRIKGMLEKALQLPP